LHDNLKKEGDVDLQTAYMQSYVQKAEPVRPEIKRMHSTLAVAGGDFASEAQDSFIPLDEAQKSQMTRPRTCNRLQDWIVNEPSGRNRMNGNNAQQKYSQPMTRDQVVAQQARRKHQATESSFSLGGGQQTAQHHEADGSLYKKSFTLPAIEPCPAAVLHVDDKSNYQFTRELHNHRFYRPIINSMG
jgi:hypothetical protein